MASNSAEKDKDKEATTKPAFEYTDEMIQKAADLIAKQGYVTRKDIPEMKDLDWAYGLGEEVDKYFNNKNAGRYIYHEDFDFDGGDIADIIFDMDQVKTRNDALKKLGEVLGDKIINGHLDEIEHDITN
ncbi:hypothetical protein IWT140_01123 [Secundilactobacillus pentosiphilus]|uniref:Uncharacterized protein n=1 Tax=Secundilactobacillus pentosiphilus TaxID=1714682 RepID=A0A1Z5IXY5_9LACO|nr:hypothetical protein [Secundilactobacillus pentosiphilus]GAX03519.1 hypothetical protein IWT140_01123 [Secundilactobacillus pentosiphilus]GAX06643.1 hypothetical protein IWT25_01988 [Secundilactobacillus pentosiphilus]